MTLNSPHRAYSGIGSQFLWEDGERIFRRGWQLDDDGKKHAVLIVQPTDYSSRSSLDRLTHEYDLKDEFGGDWAVRPLDLLHDSGRTVLMLEDAGGEPVARLIGAPMEVGRFLRLAIAMTHTLGKFHQRGLVHKDIKPSNFLFSEATGEMRLSGFGIASRVPRERQPPHPPETIAGTLAYMAPEQTGRMNRSIDSRSDLYALGVTLYQMLTGALPFTATDPMEWVHYHLARQPAAPAERLKEIPAAVSAIVMKLLAKRAEDRYQTAAGLEGDLRRCQSEWKAHRQIDDFPLGENDTPNRLLIPEKLYGRKREAETLLASFDRIVNGGAPELVLVSGYSGIGKSSVVNELQPVLVLPRAFFAAGKFDQFKRDIPYSTVAQAFQGLVRLLLAKSDDELAEWRESLREALGPNGQLMVDLVPELKLIIGEQAPVPELPPQDAQRRFQLVFRRFLTVFAKAEHPLALFLDDLQWLDTATLDLLQDLLTNPDVRHVLLIGAYRDNEVTAHHPLMRTLDRIRGDGVPVQDVVLAPLAREDLDQLVADALYCDRERAGPLADLVLEKTGGNPFFVIQFLTALVDEGLLTFDHGTSCWLWDLPRIHAKRYTDNVVDLMVDKLNRLPASTQKFMQQLACLGSGVELSLLDIVSEGSYEELRRDLQEALRTELVLFSEGTCRFLHDRVQEAAYSLIPEAHRAEVHLRIGRELAKHTAPEKRDEAIFEIVGQFNRGAALITSQEEREHLAELNLAAGKRAKASSAFASALTYLTAGAALLSEETWERRQELVFALELHSADCNLFLGTLQAVEERLATLAMRAADTVQRCAVTRRRADLYALLGDSDQAVAVCLECLGHVGIDLPTHPTKMQSLAAYERFWSGLGSRRIEDLIELPVMHDAESLAILDLLTVMTVPTHYTDENLHALVIGTAANLCLQRGNSDAAPVSYAAMGLIASARFGHHDEGYRLAKMACSLIERAGLKHFGGGRAYFNLAVLIPWKHPLKEAIDPARRAFQMGKDLGHPAFGTFAGRTLVSVLLASGHPLDQLEQEAEDAAEFVRPYGFFLDRISAALALVRMLRGRRTTKFGSLDDVEFTESSFEEHFTGHPTYAFLEGYYWIRKLQARFFAGDYESAVDAADKAEKWYETSVALAQYIAEMADCRFYAALARAAVCEPTGSDSYAKHREALRRNERQLQDWAASCPQNFEDRAALVGAEIARLEERPLDAMSLYERSIGAARANGFVHNEAIANELAARFHAARGFETIANAYLREARACYQRWGADGKVRQLDQLHPRLRQDEGAPGPTGTIEASVEQLDLAMVIEVSQALSGEIVVEKLIDRFMRAAIEQAGAERALLVAVRGEELRTSAEAAVHGDEVTVQVRQHPARDAVALPDSLIRYSIRTRDPVVLDDAMAQNPFSADPYILTHHVRSVLSLPLINQGKLIGILYLENNLTSHVFTPGRVAVIKVLASQAAISLENTGLYHDLADREARIRRLWDSNILGICIWNIDGAVVSANDEFLRMVQYDHQEVAAGRLNWAELTPPEWRKQAEDAVAELRSSGSFRPLEKEYFRKDGSRIPVLIGGALFENGSNEGVAYVLDLTERKSAENALRESEERFRDYAETASDWLWEMDPDHKLTMLTGNAFGSSPSARLGTSPWDRALDVETEPEKWRVIRATMDARQPFRDFVYLAAGVDGPPIYVKASGRPVFDEKGKFQGYRGVGTDATAIIRAEEALRQSERSLRSVIDGIAGLVAVVGPNGELETVNRQVLEYFGRPAEELRDWGTISIVHPEDLPRVLEIFKRSIAAGIPFHYETRMKRFDGEYRWFAVRFTPIRDDSGSIVRWYILLTDIEDRTQAQARLQQMQADFAHINRVSMMGELAASLSHEITQPIASARNNARAALNFLDRQSPDLGEVREALGCIVGDADRAGDILGRIREQIKKTPPRKDHFDLNAAINEVITLAQSAIAKNEVSVQTRLADKLITVDGDRVQLQQVVLNLILNAVEAMGSVEEGTTRELVIATGQDHTGVLVAIRDSGPGISPAQLERVFDAFYTTKSNGTGMGLSICRSIVNAHGGRMWAEKNKPRGAIFQFTLPAKDARS